ncbi:MAG TPA: hypothetical protein VH575_22940 [Gemmataceae bacterium]|jgi:hypothetical protein
MRAQFSLTLVALLLPVLAQAQDVASGPEKGAKVPALKVFDATGAHQGKEVDYAADRKDKPTVYLFVNAEKFDRPMNRFMKTLDGAIVKDFEGVYVVAVWLTKDADKTKDFLPRVQQSVRYEATALTVFAAAEGPKGWNVNADAHLTAVVANKGKVAATFGYESLNETDVPKVKEALSKAMKGK